MICLCVCLCIWLSSGGGGEFIEDSIQSFIEDALDSNEQIIQDTLKSIADDLIAKITIETRRNIMKSIESPNLYDYSELEKIDIQTEYGMHSEFIKTFVDHEFVYMKFQYSYPDGVYIQRQDVYITNYANVGIYMNAGYSKNFRYHHNNFWIPLGYINVLAYLGDNLPSGNVGYEAFSNVEKIYKDLMQNIKETLATRIFIPQYERQQLDNIEQDLIMREDALRISSNVLRLEMENLRQKTDNFNKMYDGVLDIQKEKQKMREDKEHFQNDKQNITDGEDICAERILELTRDEMETKNFNMKMHKMFASAASNHISRLTDYILELTQEKIDVNYVNMKLQKTLVKLKKEMNIICLDIPDLCD